MDGETRRALSQRHLASQSLQFLRGKAHALLEEKFPRKPERYAWLRRNSPKLHMSQMDREELRALIGKIAIM